MEEYEEAFRVLISRAAVGKVGVSPLLFNTALARNVRTCSACLEWTLMLLCAGAAAAWRCTQPSVSGMSKHLQHGSV